MAFDGVTISTAAITALIGGGGIGAWVMRAVSMRRCDKCDAHDRIDSESRRTREDIAAIRADIRNICRSVDELRDDIRALGAARRD